MTTAIDLTEAINRAKATWNAFSTEMRGDAIAPSWRTGTAADGAPLLTAEVVGAQKVEALHRFASQYPLALRGEGDQRPAYEYHPGRTVCVWRTSGVWVELWHPDPVTPPTEPVQAPAPRPVPKPGPVSSPSGRLPLGTRLTTIRRTLTNKEN